MTSFHTPELTLPVELKRELFGMLSTAVARQIMDAGLSEEEILEDFETWRKERCD